MGLNVSSLPAYVDEQRLPLVKKAVLGSKSAGLFTLQTGVKDAAVINRLETDVVFGDGSTCGFDEAGTSKLSQRKIQTGHVKINMSFCDKALLKTWAGHEVKVAAGEKALPFEQDFTEDIVNSVNKVNEKAVWQGDITSLDANLNKYDGIIKIYAGLTPTTDYVAVPAASGATVTSILDAVYVALPAEVTEGAAILMGIDKFKAYVQELKAANLYHYDGASAGLEINYPGTDIRVIGLAGLTGTNRIFAGQLDNFHYGVDLEGDEEQFDLWYSKDNQEHRLAINFNVGVQVAFPTETVMVTIATA